MYSTDYKLFCEGKKFFTVQSVKKHFLSVTNTAEQMEQTAWPHIKVKQVEHKIAYFVVVTFTFFSL